MQSDFPPACVDVLIVGAGPVGLALAIELGHRGVGCLIVEQQERGGKSPRAKTSNVRTLEHFRRWGIAGKLREASPLPVDYPPTVVFATRLNGYSLAEFDNVNYCAPIKNDLFPEHGQWVPQYSVEGVMRDHLGTLPSADIRFGFRLDSARQVETHVEATVTHLATGKQHIIRCLYMAGADGARTTVRNEILKVPMQGQHAYDWNYTVVFRAPGLAEKITVGKAIMYWLVNTDAPCICGPMDEGDLWFFMATSVNKAESLPEDPKATIRRSTGLDFDMEIESVEPWAVHKLMAEKYRLGRIFLAGDACHLHPPTGGYGMNMGIGDAVDLGWKLAAVLQGWGGEHLLASYERERKPIHDRVINQAVANYALLGNHLIRSQLELDGEEADNVRGSLRTRITESKKSEFYTLGVILGDGYRESPLICYDASMEDVPDSIVDYVPSSVPGSLAPHMWLSDGDSLYDHFGVDFTLLCTVKAKAASVALAQSLAQERNVPLKVLTLGDMRLPTLYETSFTLIRPDRFVAWRGDELDNDFGAVLDKARGF